MTLLVVLFLSMSFTLVATPLLITKLKASGIVDKPGERRINRDIVPRMGGIVILFSILIIIFSFSSDLAATRGFLYGIIIISLCGIIDDILGLKWNYKFLLQFISALVIVFSLNLQSLQLSIFFINFPNILSQLILLIFIIGFVNSINFMDGLDGLVSGYSVAKFTPLLFFSILQGDYLLNIIILATVGSLIGFLKYNAYPAKIFLGDTGSLLLGYVLVYSSLAISSIHKVGEVHFLDLTFAIILFSVPILDTLRVIIVRLLKGSSPFSPDKIHMHHILFDLEIPHKKVVFLIQFFSLFYIIDSIIYVKYSNFLAVGLWVFSLFFFFNPKPIVIFLRKNTFLVSILGYIRKIVEKITEKNRIYLSLFSILLSGYILFYLIKNIGVVKHSFVLPVFVIIFFLFIIATFNKRKADFNKNFYIYINFEIFFIILLSSSQNQNVFFNPNDKLVFYATITLILIISLFLLIRKSLLAHNNALFFNGFDLSIIIITSSLFIINKFMVINEFGFLLPCSIYSLIFYFWYKILSELYQRYKTFLYYSSFVFPLVALLFALKS